MPDNHNAILPMFSQIGERPAAQYRTIVADPPWRYEKAGGYSWRKGRPSGETRPMLTYPTMTVDEIANVPVGLWAEDRAHLYLWTTSRYLRDACRIVELWSFEYRKVLVWCKAPTGFSMGGAFGNSSEFIVTGVRGNFSYKERVSRDWFEWRRGEHSEKPQAFYDLVEQMSFGPYLDVFARKQRMGWDVFGNEAYNPPAILKTLTPEQAEGLVGA